MFIASQILRVRHVDCSAPLFFGVYVLHVCALFCLCVFLQKRVSSTEWTGCYVLRSVSHYSQARQGTALSLAPDLSAPSHTYSQERWQ